RVTAIQESIRTIAATSTDIGKALYTDQLYRQVAQPLVALDQDLARLQSGQGSVGALLRDNAQYDQAQSVARDLRQTVTDFRKSPFVSSDSMYRDLNRSLTHVIRSVQDLNANPMIAGSHTYENLNGAARELRNAIHDFRQDPRKYLRMKMF